MKIITIAWMLFGLQAMSGSVLGQEFKYREPAPELLKIDMKKIGLDAEERASLATNLAEQCRNLTYNAAAEEFCYRAMSLAFLLDPENRAAIVADSLLKRNTVKHVKRPIPLSSDVLTKIKKLTKSGKEEEIRLAGYLLSVALKIDKENEDLIYENSLFEKRHGKVSWALMDKGAEDDGSGNRIQRGVHPAYRNKPKDLAKKFSSVNALVVQQRRDGSMRGDKLEVMANILETPGSRHSRWQMKDGAHMGRQMRVAIDESIRVLEVRYPVKPQGIMIQFSFSDKYTPKDGGSIGTAFSLLLLSLFDDFKVDEKVALTGDITVDWKTRKVGGVVEKIMGAKAAGMEIVIIPESNKGNVEDLVVLNSAKSVLDISIFAAKNLEEVIEIARTDKRANLKEGLERLVKLQSRIKNSYRKEHKASYLKELDAIIELMPNNLSAQAIRKSLRGEMPKRLSTAKSVEEILANISNLNNLMPQGSIFRMQSYSIEELKHAKVRMGKLRPILSKDAEIFYKDLITMINAVIEYQRYNKNVFEGNPQALAGGKAASLKIKKLNELFNNVRQLDSKLVSRLDDLSKKIDGQ